MQQILHDTVLQKTKKVILFICLCGICLIAGTTYSFSQYSVINNSDSGAGSFRQAIIDANANPGLDTISFDISGSTLAERTIITLSAIPDISDSLVIDGTTQTNGSPIGTSQAKIVIDGNAGLYNGLNSIAYVEIYGLYINNFGFNGIVLQQPASNCIIGAANKGNFISRNSYNGIVVLSNNTIIQSNIVGCDTIGGTGNTLNGIFIGGDNHTIGGTGLGEGNLVYGNGEIGIEIQMGDGFHILGNTASGNQNGIASFQFGWGSGAIIPNVVIKANKIGTDISGTIAVPNLQSGIALEDCQGVLIGDTLSSGRNIISGNTSAGIYLNSCDSAMIYGNYIGTDLSGNLDLGNGDAGIIVGSSSDVKIGRANADAANLISGNLKGIYFEGSNSFISGNAIGLSAIGSLIGNTFEGVRLGGTNNTVGGYGAEAGNVIMGNGEYGIQLAAGSGYNILGNIVSANKVGIGSYQFGWGSGVYLSGVVIKGNLVGTDHTGSVALPNMQRGIALEQCTSAQIGDTTIEGRNIISGNLIDAINIIRCDSAVILGNLIGTDASGTQDLGNGSFGIVNTSSNYVTIGGASANAGNIICGNNMGIYINANNNLIIGNYIGSAADGSIIGNTTDGISLGGNNNTFGGLNPGEGNIVLGSGEIGIKLQTGSGHNILGNITSGNQTGIATYQFGWGGGVYFTGVVIKGNLVGTDYTGTITIPNTERGIAIDGCTGVQIGDTTAEGRNIVSGNLMEGIYLMRSDNSVVQGNYIGTDISGTLDLGNGGIGLRYINSNSNTIGGFYTNAGNIISANSQGLDLYSVSNSIIAGNHIGTDISGSINLGNSTTGISLLGTSSNNLIGDNVGNTGNVIAYNGSQAVVINGASADSNQVRKNSMFNNSLISGNGGISLQGGANMGKQPPQVTIFNDVSISGTSAPFDTIELFTDTCNYVEGVDFVESIIADASGNWSISGNYPGFYAITATDSLGNTSEFDRITMVGDLAVVVTPTNVSCYGMNDGTITAIASDGYPPYGYAWSSGDSSAFVSGLFAGTYIFTITDSNGGMLVGSVNITQPTELSVVVQTVDASTMFSTDGSAQAFASGGFPPYIYVWQDSTMGSSISDLGPGFYCVGVIDMLNCQDTACGIVSYGISVPEMSVENNFDIFPNPNRGEFTIEINFAVIGISDLIEIDITNLNGESVYKREFTGQKRHLLEDINATNLATGVYIVGVKYADKIIRKKLIIE